jgi:hypothetical protein
VISLQKQQAYDIWVESKGKIDLETIAMLIGVSEDQINDWIIQEDWCKAFNSLEKVPYQQEITKYETHVLPRFKDILQWLKDGMTEYSIADKLGIARSTLTGYKSKYATFQSLYARAQDERNCLVMNSMYRKALGEKASLNKQKVTKDGDVIDIIEEVYIPPDVNAADLYLRNNDDKYKSAKSDVGNMTLIQNNFQLPQVTQQIKLLEEELKRLEAPQAVDVEVIEG